jgi:hypothetical protein
MSNEHREQTPALTEHARLRCTQMKVTTRRAKRVVQRPSSVYPGPPQYGENFIAVADFDPDIQVAYTVDDDGRKVIKTVLWSTTEFYVRPDAKVASA